MSPAYRVLNWLPVVLFLGMATCHLYLRYQHDLSPWLGAGFGMFSTTDSVSARQVVVYGLDANGFGRELAIPEELSEEAKRVQALPSTVMLKRFVTKLHAQRLESDCYVISGCVFDQYRIEIWRARYDKETLLPDGERIVDQLVALSGYE